MYELRRLALAGIASIYTAMAGCSGCDKPKVGYDDVRYIDEKGFLIKDIKSGEIREPFIFTSRADGKTAAVIHLPLGLDGKLATDKKGEPILDYMDPSDVTVKFDFVNRKITVPKK